MIGADLLHQTADGGYGFEVRGGEGHPKVFVRESNDTQQGDGVVLLQALQVRSFIQRYGRVQFHDSGQLTDKLLLLHKPLPMSVGTHCCEEVSIAHAPEAGQCKSLRLVASTRTVQQGTQNRLLDKAPFERGQ